REASLSKLVGPKREKADVIGNFLALLEMVKQRSISIEQRDDGEIVIGPPPVEDQPGV
ncbi:MAG: segregation/condensation protein A, partial [Planctomycetes bacterium]|nr:segregation/condensation protein A [Planctomycetota bacterium]